MNEYDRKIFSEIMSGHGTWYNARLIRFIAKADRDNMELLHKIYPEQVELVYKYQNGKEWNE